MTIQLGGINQYIQIKGQDEANPILLFLHGGPGGSLMGKTDLIAGELQQHFVVVQWDQREVGQTLRLNKSPQPLTLELFYRDAHDLIDTLLKRYQKPKLYLVGYSWGTSLGFNISDKYPELLYAYIAVCPVIDQWRSDSLSLAMLRETMGEKARNELVSVKIPFGNWEQLYIHRKWLLKQEGHQFVVLRKSFVQAWAATWFNVWSHACDVNLFVSLKIIKCPVYFFAGRSDFQTNYAITEAYFNQISAPQKELFLFEGAGHGLLETHSSSFQDFIIDKILPETYQY